MILKVLLILIKSFLQQKQFLLNPLLYIFSIFYFKFFTILFEGYLLLQDLSKYSYSFSNIFIGLDFLNNHRKIILIRFVLSKVQTIPNINKLIKIYFTTAILQFKALFPSVFCLILCRVYFCIFRFQSHLIVYLNFTLIHCKNYLFNIENLYHSLFLIFESLFFLFFLIMSRLQESLKYFFILSKYFYLFLDLKFFQRANHYQIYILD